MERSSERHPSDHALQRPVPAPLVPVTVAFLLGLLLGACVVLHPLALGVAGLLSAWAALWGRRQAKARVGAVLLLWLSLGALRLLVWEAHPSSRLTAILPEEPQRVQIHGVVVEEPVVRIEAYGRGRGVSEQGQATSAQGRGPGARGAPARDMEWRPDEVPDPLRRATLTTRPAAPDARHLKQLCVLALRHARVDGWQPVSGRVRMTVQQPRTLLRYGDDVLADGEWERVPGPGNPGQYDRRSALARQRIHGELRIAPHDGVAIVRRGQGHPVLAAVFRLRQRWSQLLHDHVAPPHAGALQALLLGDRSELDEELAHTLRETGVFHLWVISGFNVGVVWLLLEMSLRLVGVPWRLRLLAAAAGLGGYCLLTGLAPPVARATVMAWVALGAFAWDRAISWPNALAAAALAILWGHPAQLFDPGFQLSFGAVVSLLVFTRRWHPWLMGRLGWLRPAWARRFAALSLSATVATWVGLLPVLAWYFHLVSPVSLLANLLLAPLVSAAVFLGTALLALGTYCEPAVRWGSYALAALLEVAIWCAEWCRRLPGGSWAVAAPSPWAFGGYYGLLAVSVLRPWLGWRHGRVAVGWAGALVLWIWSAVAMHAAQSRWLCVDVLDVGHGDSIVVRLPRGQVLAVDAGSEEAGRYTVLPFLRARGIGRLDALLLTHQDADHIGGVLSLLARMPIRMLLTNGVHGDTVLAREVERLAAARWMRVVTVANGMRVETGSDVLIEVLHPPAGLVPNVRPASNDNSVVVRLTKGAVRIVLTGDIEEAGLPWLLRATGAQRAAVVKVPHHGSRLGASGERFFDALQPRLAILSVGRIHHLPAPETLQMLARTGARLYATRQDGAIHLRTDGRRLEVRTARGPRAWQPIALASDPAIGPRPWPGAR
jgi:competence protein ComEC